MITSFKVRNFLSLRDAALDLRVRNVLIGPNKSGKSNLLAAFRFLKQSVVGADVSAPINDRHGIENIRWKGSHNTLRPLTEPPLPVSFEIEGRLNRAPGEPRFAYHLDISGDLRGQASIRTESLDLTVGSETRRLVDMVAGNGAAKRWDGRELFSNPGDPRKPALSYDIPGWEAGLLKSEIANWQFFDLIPQLVPVASNSAAAVTSLNVHGENLSSWLHTLQVNHPADFERIAKWVSQAFPEIESLGTQVTQAGTTFLSSRERDLQAPISVFEASSGQLSFIAMTSLIYSPIAVPLTCLEEPENHLHPRLLSLLVEMVNQRRVELAEHVAQTIITTHSPYLVDLLEPEDIVLVSKHAGESTFRRVDSGDELRSLMRASESTLGRLWFSGSLGDA